MGMGMGLGMDGDPPLESGHVGGAVRRGAGEEPRLGAFFGVRNLAARGPPGGRGRATSLLQRGASAGCRGRGQREPGCRPLARPRNGTWFCLVLVSNSASDQLEEECQK